ncbi:MAG: hypothetical protein ABIZ71_03180 [Gemmatimonadales bacterium]
MGLVIASGFFIMIGLSKASSALGAASIPIWAMAIAGIVLVLRGPLGEALLHSIAQSDTEQVSEGVPPELIQDLDDLRAQVSELQERVDFTERLLARERETRPLNAGGAP